MNRREFLALGGAGAAVAGLSLAEAMSGGRNEPNLLVIITDDQPYYTVSHTKAVASLIRDRGTTFSPYAYVSTPICGPARATLLTGKWSHNTGLTKTAGAYQDLHASIYESDTIATRLKQAGYRTYFGGKYTNGYDGNAIPPGWDAWFAMVEPLNKADSFLYRNSSRTRRYHRVVDNETDVLSVNAERFVRDQAGSSVPWFAYVCPHAPHSSYYPAPGEHGLHKKNIPYEEACRTPFIVRGPGVRSGFKSSVMVSHTDLPPTLLDLAGALWADLDGRSLVPVFSAGGGQPAGWRNEIFVEDLGRGWNMLRTPQWAYVEWDDAEKELYDMEADPYQLQSLHADPGKADLIARLSSQLSDLKGAY